MDATNAKKYLVRGIGGIVALLIIFGAWQFFKWYRDPERIRMAAGEHAMAKHLAEPVDLTGHTQGQVWDFVPSDLQTFNDVPFQIDGLIQLWGEGGATNGMDLPEEVTGISIGKKFETLYVYEGSYYKSAEGTPVYNIVFRYDDGSSATNAILYGDDVLDWFANRGKKVQAPGDRRSKLAWTGEAEIRNKQQGLRFCMTAVENPFPAITVTSIDLYSCKNRTVAVILAMTTGKSGLMPAHSAPAHD